MIVLGIETTCDETACSIVKDGHDILSNVIASQIDLHALYGGVFPEMACRRHIDTIIPVIKDAMKQAGVTQDEIDLIAVAKGPGLIGALLIGLQSAKSLSWAWQKPLIGVNHVEAHLYAAMMGQNELPFPALGVVISGGHTFLVRILGIGEYVPIGTTVDDAIGEAFDKVGNLLGLSYPGGPAIEKLALTGDAKRFPLKAGKVKGAPLDFSFSGIKTNVLYTIKNLPHEMTAQDKADLAASFQETALRDIVQKTTLAAQTYPCSAIYFGGGVTSSRKIRDLMAAQNLKMPIFWPTRGLSLDNAAMIAGLGYHKFIKNGKGDPLDLDPQPRIPLSQWC